MEKNTKEWIQYGSAVGMLVSGVLLTFLCFFLNNFDVKDSVLFYVAQCLVYAGSVFGIKVYVDSKYGEAKHIVENIINSKKESNK